MHPHLSARKKSDLVDHGYEELCAVEGFSTHRDASARSSDEKIDSPRTQSLQQERFAQSLSSKLIKAAEEFSEITKG